MKPPPFDYVAAQSVDDAVTWLSDDRDVRVLAGGQSLLPILNLRLGSPEVLVDIGSIEELGSIEASKDRLTIGAAVTQRTALLDDNISNRWPLLSEAIRHVGHPQIRNRGTVCGSLAHNDPQAELPATAVALEAEFVVQSTTHRRRIAAADFFDGPFATVLQENELLVAVEFPAQPPGWGFNEFANRPGDFALAGAVCVFSSTDSNSHVVMFGLGSGPLRATAVEEALQGGADADGLREAVTATIAGLDPSDDVHASAASRRTLMSHVLLASATQAQERSRTETQQ